MSMIYITGNMRNRGGTPPMKRAAAQGMPRNRPRKAPNIDEMHYFWKNPPVYRRL